MIAMRGGLAVLLIALSVVSFSKPAQAQHSRPAQPQELTVGGSFLDTISGTWIGIEPQFAHKPSLNEFRAALGGHLPEDFGLAFSCWVKPSGVLHDCRPSMTAPDNIDGGALTRALAPLIMLTQANAQMAADKEYRLGVRVAFRSWNPAGQPHSCYPPYCIANDPPPPPPPPPQAKDPFIRTAIKQSQDCFWSKWDRSSDLRFAAEKAVRDNQQQPPPEKVRAAVLEYVHSRLELKKCIAQLTDVSHRLPAFGDDRKALEAALQSMRFNYSGQTPYELAIVISLIDKKEGQAEQNFQMP